MSRSGRNDSGAGRATDRRRLGARAWSVRFAWVVLAACVLAWAWSVSGLGGAGTLWTNRDRAVEYIMGRKGEDVPLEQRRAQAIRDVRTQMQLEARETIEAEYTSLDEPAPGLMALMRESEARARDRIDALPPGEFESMVQSRLDEDDAGERRGGYFPPETDPIAIFGDPDDLAHLPAPLSRLVEAADETGGWIARGLRWTLAALTGHGYTGQLLETVAIALWGTLLAVFLAVPASLLGSPVSMAILWPGQSALHRVGRWVGRFVVRRSFDISRGFNEIVLAMIFVAVLGLGPLPGVLALLIHTYGVLGKVFSEAIETIDRKQVEGVEATGAAPTQVISFAVLTQINPYLISQSLLRFEANVRGATILGVVGAGGIGQLLMDKFGAYEFQEVATMMILIIAVVTLIDLACTRTMRRFV